MLISDLDLRSGYNYDSEVWGGFRRLERGRFGFPGHVNDLGSVPSGSELL